MAVVAGRRALFQCVSSYQLDSGPRAVVAGWRVCSCNYLIAVVVAVAGWRSCICYDLSADTVAGIVVGGTCQAASIWNSSSFSWAW